MARVELNDLVQSVRGSLSKESDVCFRVINGKTYMFRKPGREPDGGGRVRRVAKPMSKSAMERKIALQQRFKEAQEMKRGIMSCAALRRVYERQWRKQKKYPTLAGYIFAKCYEINV